MAPASVDEAAPAKINLTLHVAAPRPDGLHPLRSLVVFAPDAADRIVTRRAVGLSLRISGPMGQGLSAGPDNLVVRAAQALAEAAGIAANADLLLDKHLPVASGIGGGSADAAAALRALNRLWQLDWTPAQLERVASGLGSDVAACVSSQPVWMAGTGSELEPAPLLPPMEAILVNPGIPCPTGPVYRALDAAGAFGALDHPPLPSGPVSLSGLTRWMARCRNDLEPPAITLVPAVGVLLAQLASLPGVALARLSGSGATCFGLTGEGSGAVVNKVLELMARRASGLDSAVPWVCRSRLGAGLAMTAI
jgi:4-diphosphocytidyl-2-C-methyl-D-erythritol kinase